MKKFFATVDSFKEKIEKMKQYNNKMEEFNTLAKGSIMSKKKEKKLNNKIEALSSLFEDISYETKNGLISLKKENQQVEKIEEQNIRNNQWYILTKELSNEINRFHTLQIEKSNQEKERIRYQYQIFNPNATKEELDNIDIESVNITGKGNRKMVKKAKKRNENLKKLMKSVQQIVQMLNDLNEMVKEHAKDVENIQENVEQSRIYSKEGVKNLEAGLAYQKRAMWIKRMVIGFIISILIFFIIISFILALPSIIF